MSSGRSALPASRKRPRAPSPESRVVIVTGAGGGIGRAVALHCAQLGFRVVGVDKSEVLLAALSRDADELGEAAQLATLCKDCADEAQVQETVEWTVSKFGRLDCSCNAAGVEGERGRLHESSALNYDQVMSTNARSVFLCMRAQCAQFLKQEKAAASAIAGAGGDEAAGAVSGTDPPPSVRRTSAATAVTRAAIDERLYSIVNVASTAGTSAMPEFSAYSASKFAIMGLTRTAAREYAGDGIRVNAVCPSTTDTCAALPLSLRAPHNPPPTLPPTQPPTGRSPSPPVRQAYGRALHQPVARVAAAAERLLSRWPHRPHRRACCAGGLPLQ